MNRNKSKLNPPENDILDSSITTCITFRSFYNKPDKNLKEVKQWSD